MRKLVILLAAASVVLASPKTFAFDEFRMVDAAGSYTDKSSFGWNETPYLYIKRNAPVNLAIFWLSPENVSFFRPAQLNADNSYEAWITLVNWEASKKAGEWKVKGFGVRNPQDCATTSFMVTPTVTPEPLSLALFGIGGLPLAARFIRRKK